MIRFFVRHPVTTWMIFTAFVVLGVYALPKLQIEAIPEVNLPTLTIQTSWNGASPEAIHRSITLPIEESVGRVHGVEKLVSTSRAGRSQVEVSFGRDINLDFARVELNEQLGAIRRNLPLNAAQPQIMPFVPQEFETEAFFTISLSSSLSPNDLREQAETWIIPQVLAVEGVADATVQGGADPVLQITLDRELLDLYGINADQVFQRVNALDNGGGAGAVYFENEEKLVVLNSHVDSRELENTVIERRGERNFQLKDLGRVVRGYGDPQYFVRTNGKNVVRVTVEKRSGSNTVAVSRALREALPVIQSTLPFEASFHVDDDQGEDLRQKLEELLYRSLAILGVLFVLLVLSLRQVRLTAIVIASILFAIMISLSLFYFLHISVNFITISGLTICFGLILDNSILVLDSIHRRLNVLGKADDAGLSRQAKFKVAVEMIVGGAGDVLFPILATTLTTMVAFASFIFLSGRLALFYIPLAISVATAMAASLFVAFGWIPVALNQGWARSIANKSPDGSQDIEDADTLAEFVEDLPDLESPLSAMERITSWTQKLWPIIVPAVAALTIWSFVHVYEKKVDKGGFWRLPDPERLFLYLELPAGTDIVLTSETVARFEETIVPVRDGARMTTTVVGNRAFINIEFEDELKESEVPYLYRTNFIAVADKTGGSSIYISGFSDQPYFKGAFRGSALNSLIKLTGYNSKRLGEIAEDLRISVERQRRARKARITSGMRFDRSFNEETVLSIDREKLGEHNMSVLEVVGTIRRLLGVDTPWSMLIDGKQRRAQLTFEDAEDIQYEDVAGKTIQNSKGEEVKLASLISLETKPVKGAISRENQRYSMFVNWEYVGTDKMRRDYIGRLLKGADMPYGYTVEESEQTFFSQEEEEELKLTLILALVFIFMVLAALFESLSLPILVLSSVPLALVGVFIAFWWADATFDSSARIGLVLLFGIVVNNAILLVSRFRSEAGLILKAKLGGNPGAQAALFRGQEKRLGGSDLDRLGRERGALLRRAVARGTHARLRSILLTSGTTIAGLAPLLIDFHKSTEGQDIWENLALSSIGGLVASTLLLLLALPPLYYGVIQTKWAVLRWSRWVVTTLSRKKPAGDTAEPVYLN